jgi:two-component system, chemotaxis family, chemotaxis protein CheY
MRALIVDDSRPSRIVVRMVLKDLQMEVLEAENGRRALELVDQLGPGDVIFVDWNMPALNGLDFIRALRADPRYNEIRVVMVTVNGDQSEVNRALEAGANEYLMKPFDREMIKAKLQLLDCPLAS